MSASLLPLALLLLASGVLWFRVRAVRIALAAAAVLTLAWAALADDLTHGQAECRRCLADPRNSPGVCHQGMRAWCDGSGYWPGTGCACGGRRSPPAKPARGKDRP